MESRCGFPGEYAISRSKQLNLFRNKAVKILDVGCTWRHTTEFFSGLGEVVGWVFSNLNRLYGKCFDIHIV
jgi:hypothetical protein